MVIFKIFSYPLGVIMKLIYELVSSIPFNYFFTIILFTIFIKAILFPLAIKQQKDMIKNQVRMSAFQPKLEKLKKQYANNKQKYQEEMTKLYQEEGMNPMKGCLSSLIQLPILFGLMYVIYEPLTFVFSISKDIIVRAGEVAATVLNNAQAIYADVEKGIMQTTAQIQILTAIQKDQAAFTGIFDEKTLNTLSNVDMEFFGINLGDIPQIGFSVLLLIPILSCLTSFLSIYVSTKMSSSIQSGQNVPGMGATKVMLFIMPIFSLFIALQFPVGMSLYWTISNILMVIQTLVIYKIWKPAKMKEKFQEEEEKRREELRKSKKVTIKTTEVILTDGETVENTGEEVLINDKKISQKEFNKLRLAKARELDAEKYGEDYQEADDKN